MSQDEPKRLRDEAPGAFEITIATLGLGALAVAYPLLEVIGRGPEFLVAHRLSFGGIVILVVVLVLVPLAVTVVVLIARSVSGGLGVVALWGVVAVLGGLLTIQFAKRLPVPDWVMVIGAGVAAAVFATAYLRLYPVRLVVRYLALAPLVVAVWFILALPTSLRAGSPDDGNVALRAVTNPVPVVMVIFDEFPTASLIDTEGNLLRERFPGFARLASDGVWYRQNTTVHETTTRAVPAILSGMETEKDSLPIVADHPRTLFTFLSETHDVSALETVTDLCPEEICGEQPDAKTHRTRLLSDLMILYGHVILPSTWSVGLPPIDQGWAGFAAPPDDTPTGEEDEPEDFNLREQVKETMTEGRSRQVARFLGSLGDSATRPPLRVTHLLLPHSPWRFLPDGRYHRDKKLLGYPEEGFGEDPYFVAGAWRRHLLQVGYTDTVVGDLIDRLEEVGLYDRAMVIVTADHGITFQPNIEHKRRVFPETVGYPETVGSIVPVPLFVKYPSGLKEAPLPGSVVDTPTRTVDIVPTVLDVLGADAPADLDGVSLIDPDVPPRSHLSFRTLEDEIYEVQGDEMLTVASEKMRWFPESDLWALVPEPDLRELLGVPIDKLDRIEDPNIEVEVVPERIDPDADPFPVVEGTLRAETTSITGDELVVVTVDDHIVAITQAYEADSAIRFFVLVEPSSDGVVGAWLLADPQTLVR